MAKVRINDAQVRITGLRFTQRHIREGIDAIERSARIRAGRGEYTTGHLAATVRSRVWVSGLQVHAEVGSSARHAKWANDGTKPHVIRPRGEGYPLRFYWRRVGHVVRFMKVNHPGQAGKGWLTIPLLNEAARRRWRVITHG